MRPNLSAPFLAAGCAVVVLALSACAAPDDATPTVRLGYRPSALADVTPIVIQEESLAGSGVRVKLVAVSSPADGFTKLQNGEVDALAGMPMEAVLKQLGGQPKRPFRPYAFQTDVNGEGWISLVARKGSGVAKVSDLAGKTAASLATDQAEYLLKRILVAGGVDPAKVKTVRYNPATPLVGLRSGEYDAIFGLEPAISQAVSEGDTVLWRGPVSHFLFNDRPVPMSASLLASDFSAAHPEAARAFSDVVARATQAAKDRPDEVRKFLQDAKYGELRPEIAGKVSLPVMAPADAALRPVTEKYLADLVRDGLLAKPVDLDLLFPAAK